jgi:hypothetical protein
MLAISKVSYLLVTYVLNSRSLFTVVAASCVGVSGCYLFAESEAKPADKD